MTSKTVKLIFWFSAKDSLRSNPSTDKTINQFQEQRGGADLQRRQKAVISRMDAISSTCHYQIGLQGPTNLRTGGGKYPWRAVSCILLN